MTPLMPAECSRCGHRWQPAGGIMVENSSNITMSNVTTNCERCGGAARFLDGTFNVSGGAIELVSGPGWSWNLVEALRLGLQRVVDEQPEDPVAAIEQFAPNPVTKRLRAITAGWTREQVLALVGVILAMLTWGGVTPQDIGGWLKDLPEELNELLDHVEQNGPPPTAPVEKQAPEDPANG